MRTILIAAVIVLLAGQAFSSDAVSSPVLMVQEGRLYFPVGEESQIYANAPFVLYDGADSLLSGYIEHAWRGISISSRVALETDSLDLAALYAVLVPAMVDSTAELSIGTDIGRWLNIAGNDSLGRIELVEYDDRQAMEEDFFAGLIDAMIGFRDLSPKPADVTTITFSLPYVAALVPNIGRPCNYQGQLSTSLYYRFDSDHLAISFDGDRVTMVPRFSSRLDETAPELRRVFPYNPTRGHNLFEAMTNRPDSLAIFCGAPALDGVAHFFADLVARDRCRVELTDSRRRADLRIEFVPISRTVPSATVYDLYYGMTMDTLAGSLAAEQVRRISAEMRFIESQSLPTDYYRHLDIAGNILTEDLGVFPLFRPMVFLHSRKDLQNVRIGPDNELDFANAVIVHLPLVPTETLE